MLKLRQNKRIAITLGDPTGVGPELVASMLKKHQDLLSRVVLVGDKDVFARFWTLKKNLTFVHIRSQRECIHQAGKPTIASGKDALLYLKEFVRLYQQEKVHALLTAPVSKEFIAKTHKGFQGHTQWLAEQFHCKDVEMLFVTQQIALLLLSIHLPLKDVSKMITKKRVCGGITTAYQFLKKYYRKNINVALCGLNPHAGENGLLGMEEKKIIMPSMEMLAKNNIKTKGPFSADTIMEQYQKDKFDLLVSMYHDQVLPVFKTLYFDQLVNVTAGLPFIRTSPVHGTAFNIAGKGVAKDTSMESAFLWIVNHL